eukprot:2316435-Alexandrium_andersonii.AAC.1
MPPGGWNAVASARLPSHPARGRLAAFPRGSRAVHRRAERRPPRDSGHSGGTGGRHPSPDRPGGFGRLGVAFGAARRDRRQP